MCFFDDVRVAAIDEFDVTGYELIAKDEVDVVEEVTAPTVDEDIDEV